MTAGVRASASLSFADLCMDRELSCHPVEQSGEIVEGDQPISVNDIPDGEDDSGNQGRPDQLALELWDGRCAGIAALHNRPAFLLTAYSPGQHREQPTHQMTK